MPPRFAEDLSLSEWVPVYEGEVDTEGYVATVDDPVHDDKVLFNQYVDGGGDDRAREGMPIAVELVRGSDGPTDNSWKILVDGVQCPEDNHGTCFLPPPFRRKAQLQEDGDYVPGKSTKVRPLAFAVRLEREAQAPVLVEIVAEQVCSSTERRDRTIDERFEPEVFEVERTRVKPYSVDDPTAEVVHLVYPFMALPQSALAVVSYKEAEKRRERDKLISDRALWAATDNAARRAWVRVKGTAIAATNQMAQSTHETAVNVYNAQRALYEQELAEWRSTPRAQRSSRPKAPPKPGRAPKAQQAPVLKPRRGNKASLQVLSKNELEQLKDSPHRSIVIGGRQQSAARALVPLFERLLQLCEDLHPDTRARLSNLDAATAERLGGTIGVAGHAIRQKLLYEGETAALALFDVLSSGDLTSPDIVDLYRNPAVTDQPKTADEEAEKQKRIQALTDSASKGVCAFVYDHIGLWNRTTSNTHFRYRVDVTEYDGSVTSFRFEATEYDAIAAHTVYAGYYDDLADFEEVSNAFVQCLKSLPADPSLLTRGARRLLAWVPFSGEEGAPPSVADYTKTILSATRVEAMVAELQLLMQTMVLPSWPYVPTLDSDFASSTKLLTKKPRR